MFKTYQLNCRRWCSRLTTIILLIPSLFVALYTSVYADNPATGQTSQGQDLSIVIDDAIRDSVQEPRQSFVVHGTTAIGTLQRQANVLYVVDVSGSTAGPRRQDCDGNGTFNSADDLNNNGSLGDTLDCEISGVLALNSNLASNSSVSAGLVLFGDSAAVADVDPRSGDQNFTSPLNADHDNSGSADLAEVARSLNGGAISRFASRRVGSGTNFDNAIQAINQAFDSASTGANVAFFLSDGRSRVSTSESGPLAAASDAGTVINTYAVGSGATGCATGASLRTIADETGGTCIEVADPTQLRVLLPGTQPANIDRVVVEAGASGELPASLDALGNWSAPVAAGLFQDFPLVVTATVYATDGTTVTADIIIDPPTPTSLDKITEPPAEEHAGDSPSNKVYLPLMQ